MRRKESQNPENKIADAKPANFQKTSGRKVDHDALSVFTKADMIDKRTKTRPRNAI